MEAKIWRRLPEELLFMILARLPIRVLGKMRSVCKQWNYLLSYRDTLQLITPNWSLHSTPGFVIQVQWNRKDDEECWVIEGLGSCIYKVPLLNRIVVDTCKSIFWCHTKGDWKDLYIGIPGTGSWRQLPRPPILGFTVNAMTFDSSTRRCTLLLGIVQGRSQNRRTTMCISDSESNARTAVCAMVSYHIQPSGKGIFCKGMFYWAALGVIVAFNIADGRWTEIPGPDGCGSFFHGKLGGHDGQVVLVDRRGFNCLPLWKLTEAEKYIQIWCGLHDSRWTLLSSVAVNSGGFIMVLVTDWNMKISIFNSKGKLIVGEMRLPGHRSSQQPQRDSGSAFESNNLWWP